eukprot:COSAG03_NODE_148_length_11571_cov_9.471583_6_plen_111_part_00
MTDMSGPYPHKYWTLLREELNSTKKQLRQHGVQRKLSKTQSEKRPTMTSKIWSVMFEDRHCHEIYLVARCELCFGNLELVLNPSTILTLYHFGEIAPRKILSRNTNDNTS